MWHIQVPPTFYTDMQSTDFVFPHAGGDVMSDEALRRFWYTDYIFETPAYSPAPSRETWRQHRDNPIVGKLAPLFMRTKCILENLDERWVALRQPDNWPSKSRHRVESAIRDKDFQHALHEFRWSLDVITSVTQALLYWILQGRGDDMGALTTAWLAHAPTLWPSGLALSDIRCTPAYLHRILELQQVYASLVAVADTVEMRSAVEMKNHPLEENDGSTREFNAAHPESIEPVWRGGAPGCHTHSHLQLGAPTNIYEN